MNEHISQNQLQWFQTQKGYQIFEKVGQGLQCAVYKMKFKHQIQDNPCYAFKITKNQVLQNQSAEDNDKRQKNNKRGLLKLQFQSMILSSYFHSHPGIPTVKQSGNSHLFAYSVMQYIPNGNLKQFYKKYLAPTIDIPNKVKQQCTNYILLQIASVLNVFRQQNIVHRDLKMENIMLDQFYRVKIIDYSMVLFEQNLQKEHEQPKLRNNNDKLWDQNGLFIGNVYELSNILHRNNNFLSGSKPYLCPQSIAPLKHKIPLTHKTDIWSFGVLAYLLFYNKYPFSQYIKSADNQNKKLTTFQYFNKIRQIQPEYPQSSTFLMPLTTASKQEQINQNNKCSIQIKKQSQHQQQIEQIQKVNTDRSIEKQQAEIWKNKKQFVQKCLCKDYKSRLNVCEILELPFFKTAIYGIFGHSGDVNIDDIYDVHNPIYKYLYPKMFVEQDQWATDQKIKTKLVAKISHNGNRIFKQRYIGYYVRIRQKTDGHHWLQLHDKRSKAKTKKTKNKTKNNNNNKQQINKAIISVRTKICNLHHENDLQQNKKGSIRVQILDNGKQSTYQTTSNQSQISQIQLVFEQMQILDEFVSAIKEFRN